MRVKIIRSTALSLLAASAVALVVGCSGGTKVTGQVVEKGQPLSVGEKDRITLTLVPTDGKGTSYSTAVQPGGTFTIDQKVAGGKYRVQVMGMGDYAEQLKHVRKGASMAELGRKGPPDRFKGQFLGDKSPLVIDLAGSANLTVDLSQKSVTKN